MYSKHRPWKKMLLQYLRTHCLLQHIPYLVKIQELMVFTYNRVLYWSSEVNGNKIEPLFSQW